MVIFFIVLIVYILCYSKANSAYRKANQFNIIERGTLGTNKICLYIFLRGKIVYEVVFKADS